MWFYFSPYITDWWQLTEIWVGVWGENRIFRKLGSYFTYAIQQASFHHKTKVWFYRNEPDFKKKKKKRDVRLLGNKHVSLVDSLNNAWKIERRDKWIKLQPTPTQTGALISFRDVNVLANWFFFTFRLMRKWKMFFETVQGLSQQSWNGNKYSIAKTTFPSLIVLKSGEQSVHIYISK